MNPLKKNIGVIAGLGAVFFGLLASGFLLRGGGSPDPVGFERATCLDVVEDEGVVHLLFGLPSGDEEVSMAFFHTRSEDGGRSWTESVRLPVTHAVPGRHHRSNDPQLAVAGDRLIAVWTAQGDGPWGSGPLGTAVSNDGGETWRPGPAPEIGGDSGETGFRFPAVAADESAFHAVWIHARGDERSLRHSRLMFDTDRWSNPVVVDPHICACCWNRLEVAGDGKLVALYRDKNPSDMAMAMSADGGRTWERLGHVGPFDWRFDGCPHVGGGLAAGQGGNAGTVLASVWSGHPGHAGAYIMRSDDFAKSWRPACPTSEVIRPGRNTDMVLIDGDFAAVAWDQPAENGKPAVFYAVSTDGGETWGDSTRLSPTGERATHPRLAVSSDRILVLWSGEGRDGRLRLRAETLQFTEVINQAIAGDERSGRNEGEIESALRDSGSGGEQREPPTAPCCDECAQPCLLTRLNADRKRQPRGQV